MAEAERKAKAEVARRDRMLLETYLTVADIEDLRDRRLELLESQIKVTELYLGNLRKQLVGAASRSQQLQAVHDARRTRRRFPRTWRSTSRARRRRSSLYEQTLARTRSDQAALRASFDEDIARFRELKGG